MNAADTFLSQGNRARPAVLAGESTLTYGELETSVQRLGLALLASGLQKGDRVGLWSENNPFFVIAYLAIIRAQLVVVPFQIDIAESTFGEIGRGCGMKAVLVSRRYAGRLKPWIESLGLWMIAEPELSALPAVDGAKFPNSESGNDLAALMFTSGSTGAPKGVMVTHRNLECNTRDIVSYMGLNTTDRVMVVLPFHYCFGLSLLHSHLIAGGSVVLNNQFLYPEKVLEDLEAKQCTGLAGVPSTYQILLRKSRFKEMKFPTLRWLQQAGGKLHNPFIQEIQQSFPAVKFYLMYGQTEATARLSYLPPDRLVDKLGSIGKGLPSTRLEVLKPDDTPVEPGSDEVGEIVASGDSITLGYWEDRDETARYFRRGKLYTGDLARVDAEGFIFIVEREREMIKSGGNRVSAKEVEDVIAEIPAIVEVAVVGVPHELLGEAIKAFVVLTPSASISEAEIIEHCKRRLPNFKCPESLAILDTLPHTSAGKVAKRKLKELIPVSA
jgi:acyl-CoA synthetase (AMP-forming)/AMP-acid ligase II